ncbi:DUF3318 domain-containing protein [Candidatus Vallotiella sp. (ex Adelges kitamiensis)]|uniref:DUF3318 domain-containing protein n=1 Tax=Candidatus Vallotiella sp. (ex Adelges kitamiensis) TaxID=2864217 RepID=UPI001CE3564C|nr:DUF3318 domain-containing protein [Candidatus Vallotia sp. (ex Adelges kitamiensis)]
MNNLYSNSYLTQLAPPQESNYSKIKVRKLRKEVLLARAHRNRIDIANASEEIRQGVSKLSWIKWLIPGISRCRVLSGLPAAICESLNQYPVLSSIISATLAGSVRRLVIRNFKHLLKWTVISAAVWTSYNLWKAVR